MAWTGLLKGSQTTFGPPHVSKMRTGRYLYLSQLGAFLFVHFRVLGLCVRVVSDGVEVTLGFIGAGTPVIIITVILIPAEDRVKFM